MIDQIEPRCILKAKIPTPRRPVGTLLGCALFVATSAWLLRVDHQVVARLRALAFSEICAPIFDANSVQFTPLQLKIS